MKMTKFNDRLNYFSFKLGREKAWGGPNLYIVETTNLCNLKCPICARQYRQPDPPRIMSLDEFKRIINQARHFGKTLWLYYMNEPLTDPKLEEKIAYCAAKGIRTGISSNCVLLTEAKSRVLLKAGLNTMVMAVDGYTKATYEKIRAGAEFEAVLNNVETFLRLNQESGRSTETVLSIIKAKDTLPELQDFVDKWEEKVDKIQLKPFINWIKKEIDAYAPPVKETVRKYPCKNLWESVNVCVDGLVQACSRRYGPKEAVGDVNKNTLDEIWNGPKLRALRKQHLSGRITDRSCLECEG